MTSVAEVLKCPVKVPTLPLVYTRLLEVMNDPYSSAADVGAVIGDDPGLTARLLRLVNSAFYGYPSRIDSVKQGLSVVGTQQLHDLALATSVIGMFQDVPEDLVGMMTFWHHSLACGVCARVIATERREPNVERLFVAGLLHDIGRLMIYTKNPDGARAALEHARLNDELLHVAETKVMGYEHAKVGEALLQAWKLPASLREPVAYHHRPTLANTYPTETAIVHVADIMAHAMLLGHSGERFVPPLVAAAWDRLELSASQVPNILNDAGQQYESAVQAILRDDE
jgi:putative nucleotidyltransferase with HDIG domain